VTPGDPETRIAGRQRCHRHQKGLDMVGVRMKAAVARKARAPLDLVDIDLDEPRDDEVLVKILATGICHTDVNASTGRLPVTMPIILGHEGAGVVERTGAQVTSVVPGDKVLLAPDFCGRCRQCRQGHTAYCELAGLLVFSGTRPDGTTKASLAGEPVRAAFFGESSFAEYSLVTERNILRVDDDAALPVLCALTCGVQAGAGAVLNALQVRPEHSLAAFGVGTVGLAAVMAAAMSGAHTIIAVDRHQSRLDLAFELGATHVVNTTEVEDTVSAIRAIAPSGVDRTLDSTGVPDVILAAIHSLGIRGVCGFVAGTGRRALELDLDAMLVHGKQLRPIMGGDATGLVFLQDLIRYLDAGRLPIERLTKIYQLDQINQAFADMEAGTTIKPVIVFE
jgi:aryl-alcohol dehydrogenase